MNRFHSGIIRINPNLIEDWITDWKNTKFIGFYKRTDWKNGWNKHLNLKKKKKWDLYGLFTVFTDCEFAEERKKNGSVSLGVEGRRKNEIN